MTAGDFARAVVLYRQLVHALPDNPDLRMNLGLALHSAGRYREAVECFESVLKARPGYPPASLFMGLGRAKLGDLAGAIAPFEQVLRAEPSNTLALLELGDAYLETGRPKEAAAIFERLCVASPDSAKAWQGLGLSYNAMARQAFERLEQTAPDSSYWFTVAARTKLDQHQYGSAFYLYKRALAAEPRDLHGVHAGLAEVYRRSGHDDWAGIEERRESEIHDALAAGPGRTEYNEIGEFSSKALKAFARLSEMPPTSEIHALLALAARIQGRYLEAEQEYRAALKLEPANRQIEKELAQTLWLAHDFDSALPLLQNLRQAEPASAEINFEIGDIYLQKNEAAESLRFLSAALKLNVHSAATHAAIGKAYLQLGRATEAIPHLKAALPADSDGSVLYQLARAYKDTGQEGLSKQASDEFRRRYRARQSRREEMEKETHITAP